MLEAVIAAPGQILLHDIPRPPAPGPGEALVRVDRLSLCGSDLAIFAGRYGGPTTYPLRFGHEWSGTVIAGDRLAPGTPVTGDCSLWCGTCDNCRTDRNLCRHVEKAGITAPGFAVAARLVPERFLYPDTAGLEPDLLALAEITAVALHGLAKAPATGPALVVGAGPLGLLLALALTDRGTETHVIEPAAFRRRLLAEIAPAAHLLTPRKSAPAAASYAALAAEADHAVAFECSGTGAGLNHALRLTRAGGQVVCLGLGPGGPVEVRLAVVKGLTLTGSIGGTGAFPQALALLGRHRAAAARLITHRHPAQQAATAFARSLDDPARLKVQLVFPGEHR
jgi:L-gulonate 5-dehydrogenase